MSFRPLAALAAVLSLALAGEAESGMSSVRRPASDRHEAGSASVHGTGFVFDATSVATSQGQRVTIGEKLPAQALRQRFAGYSVRVTRGEDCLVCAVVTGKAGIVEIGWAEDGRTVTTISSEHPLAGDALGNRIGGSLAAAVGETALCDNGMALTCASTRLKGLDYVVADDERCRIEVGDGKKPVRIPACARIAGFSMAKSDGGR